MSFPPDASANHHGINLTTITLIKNASNLVFKKENPDFFFLLIAMLFASCRILLMPVKNRHSMTGKEKSVCKRICLLPYFGVTCLPHLSNLRLTFTIRFARGCLAFLHNNAYSACSNEAGMPKKPGHRKSLPRQTPVKHGSSVSHTFTVQLLTSLVLEALPSGPIHRKIHPFDFTWI